MLLDHYSYSLSCSSSPYHNSSCVSFFVDNCDKSGLGHFFRVLAVIKLLSHSFPLVSIYLVTTRSLDNHTIDLLSSHIGNPVIPMTSYRPFRLFALSPQLVFIDSYAFEIYIPLIEYFRNTKFILFDDCPASYSHLPVTRITPSVLTVSSSDMFHLSGFEYILLDPSFLTTIRDRPSLQPDSTYSHFNILIFISSSSAWLPFSNELTESLQMFPNYNIKILPQSSLITPRDVLDYYLWADLCIGSSGLSLWERIAVGLPSIFFPIAENQVSVFNYVDRLKLGFPIYHDISSSIFVSSIISMVNQLSCSISSLDSCSFRCRNFDGFNRAKINYLNLFSQYL